VPARLTLAVLIAALVAAPPAAARDRCSPKGSKTVKQTAGVRVFSITRRDVTTYYGCLRGSGSPRRLSAGRGDQDQTLDSESVSNVAIAGTNVALVQYRFVDIGVEGAETEFVVVANLRRGGRLFTAGFDVGDQYDSFVTVLLRPDGAAAWSIDGHGDYSEVDVLGATAKRAVPVAYAKGIDPKSLAFAPPAVTWTQDGATRSAAIP
jgi:hypothetical protein